MILFLVKTIMQQKGKLLATLLGPGSQELFIYEFLVVYGNLEIVPRKDNIRFVSGIIYDSIKKDKILELSFIEHGTDIDVIQFMIQP